MMKRIIALIMSLVTAICCSACLGGEEKTHGIEEPTINGNQTSVETEEPEANKVKDAVVLTDAELKEINGGVGAEEGEGKDKIWKYTNTFAGIEFTIPAAIYSHQTAEGSGEFVKRWVGEVVKSDEKEGLIPLLTAKKNVSGNVNNVAVYVEKVAEDVTAEDYIKAIEKAVDSIIRKAEKGVFFAEADTDANPTSPETWMMEKEIMRDSEKAVQKVIVFENQKGFMTTIIITADKDNMDVLSGWFKFTKI